MGKKCIVAIDEGTTGTRTVAFDSSGQIVCQSYRTLGISFPKPGWGAGSMRSCGTHPRNPGVVAQCLKQGYTIVQSASATSGNHHSLGPKTGKARLPAIVWQCRRTTEIRQRLQNENLEPLITELQGCPSIPIFRYEDGVAPGRTGNPDVCLGTVDSWLLWI